MPSISFKVGEPPEQLPSLPDAEAEAKAIAQLLNTKAIVGKDATKVAFLQHPKIGQHLPLWVKQNKGLGIGDWGLVVV